MATYTPQDALDLAQQFIHNVPLDKVGPQCCDITNSVIWRAFFWRWSISDFTAVNCTDGAQDYSSALPANFYRFHVCLLARTDLSPVEYRELDLKEYIPKDLTSSGSLDDISIFSILPENSGIRLEKATSITGSVTMQIQGEYQTAPTKIDESNLLTAFSFPDHYFGNYVEGLKYYLYKFTDDPRAGTVQADSYGRKQYTGQMGVFMAALNEMMEKEDIAGGQTSRFPESPLGWVRATNPGIIF